jgi:hypothetical protein
LYDSFFGREITTGYYSDLIDASHATARNDLAAAVAARFLHGEGRTRGRRYLAGPRLMQSIARQLGNVEPKRQAILNELVRRAADTMQWTEDAQADQFDQPPLPGLG